MAYVPDWERLSDALKRVMASDVSEEQAKLDISRAVADKKIRTRLTVVIEPDAFASWHPMVQNAQGLGSLAEWKRLSGMLARLTVIGIDEAQAKRDMCRAIAERRIKLRVRVAREEGAGSFGEHVAGTVRSGGEVEIPTDLNPDDFDWQQSRPLKPWRDARQGHSALAGLWHIEWIELLIPHDNEAVDYFEGPNVNIPPHLKPADFDWDASRPLRPWPVKPRGSRRDEWRSYSHPAALIELSVSDISKELCGVRPTSVAKIEKPARGRPADYNWAGVKTRLQSYAAQNGPVKTQNELLQKCADFASDLHPRKKTPSDKTIREAIKTHELDRAAGNCPGKSPGK